MSKKIISLIVFLSFFFQTISFNNCFAGISSSGITSNLRVVFTSAQSHLIGDGSEVGVDFFQERIVSSALSGMTAAEIEAGFQKDPLNKLQVVPGSVRIIRKICDGKVPTNQIRSFPKRLSNLIHVQNLAAIFMPSFFNNIQSGVLKKVADAISGVMDHYGFNLQGWFFGLMGSMEGAKDQVMMMHYGREVGGGWKRIGDRDERHLSDIIDDQSALAEVSIDSLEITNAVGSDGVNGAVSVAGYTLLDKANLRRSPFSKVTDKTAYMEELYVGKDFTTAEISFDQTEEELIAALTKASGRELQKLRFGTLFRERHVGKIVRLIKAGVSYGENRLIYELVISYDQGKDLSEIYDKINKIVKKHGFLQVGNIYLLADGTFMPSPWGSISGKLDVFFGAGGITETLTKAMAVRLTEGKMIARLVTYSNLKEGKKGVDLSKDWNRFSPKEVEALNLVGFIDPTQRGEILLSEGHFWRDQVFTEQELAPSKLEDMLYIVSGVKGRNPWLEDLEGVSFDKETGVYTVRTIVAHSEGAYLIETKYDTGLNSLSDTVYDSFRKAEIFLLAGDNEKAKEFIDIAISRDENRPLYNAFKQINSIFVELKTDKNADLKTILSRMLSLYDNVRGQNRLEILLGATIGAIYRVLSEKAKTAKDLEMASSYSEEAAKYEGFVEDVLAKMSSSAIIQANILEGGIDVKDLNVLSSGSGLAFNKNLESKDLNLAGLSPRINYIRKIDLKEFEN